MYIIVWRALGENEVEGTNLNTAAAGSSELPTAMCIIVWRVRGENEVEGLSLSLLPTARCAMVSAVQDVSK